MPEEFIDVRFPDDISKGSTGAPAFRTDIIEVESGHEDRNIVWEQARHTYNAALGVRRVEDFEEIRALFYVAHARGHAFRFKDWQDFKSCPMAATPSNTDQLIGVGDGTTRSFPLVKRYVVNGYEYVRRIYKPIQGTVLLAVDGTDLTPAVTSDWRIACDYDKGIISWSTGGGSFDPPAAGVNISAGFEFDVPVRFASDSFENSYEAFEAGRAECDLIEVRIHES